MKKFLILPLFLLFIVGCGPEINPAQTTEKVPEKVATLGNSNIAADIANQIKSDAAAEKTDFAYESKKYSFGLRIFPKDYKVKYLSDEIGVVFEKYTVPPKNPNKKDPYENYTVQIYIAPFENIEDYKDLNDFIARKYKGFTFQFSDYGTIAGFYVNDGVYVDATAHFFAMSKDKKIIYDAYMKVPSKYYLLEKDVFENMIKNMILL